MKLGKLCAHGAVLVLLASVGSAAASNREGVAVTAQVGEPLPPDQVRRAYPVGDLFKGCASRGEAESLAALLTRSIAPQSWKAGGGRGEVRYDPARKELVVRQTRERHADVAIYLEALRLGRQTPQRMPVGPRDPR